MTTKSLTPPGPRGLPLFGVALQVRRDPLNLLLRLAREYGDVVRLPVMGQQRILLNRPDFIQQMLLIQHAKFHKSDLTKQAVGPMLGQGLLISEGEFWRRQRRFAQPAFHRSRVNEYAPAMIGVAQKHIERWRDGETRDVASEMMAIALEVAVQTLFGTALSGEAEHVGRATAFLMRYSLGRARAPFRLPRRWPTPKNKRATREFDFLDSLVYRIIEERREQRDAAQRTDLLSLLMAALDEDGTQMTPKQLRDEAMTLFIAGHETTALLLAWTWYLLAKNPNVEAALHQELRGALGGAAPSLPDLPRLPYLHAVMKETLRLYPPAYLMARTSIAPVTIGGYEFGAGSTFISSQWVTHRDARYFDEPEAYRPERWLDGLESRLPSGAYYPFGDGPRRCIGQGFAMLEAALVSACVAQRFQFRLLPGEEVVPEPLITLRPHNGIRMVLHARG